MSGFISAGLIKYAMLLKPLQTASKSRVSNPPPRFLNLEVKKIEPHYFVVVHPQSNQNQQKNQI